MPISFTMLLPVSLMKSLTVSFIMSLPISLIVIACFIHFVILPISLCLPPTASGDILFFPVRLSVCLSVRHKSCPLYNLKTVKDFSMKLGTLLNHDETMCHA